MTIGTTWAHGQTADVENREKMDFYPTPPEATRALLEVERFEGAIWEPACGDGAMSRVLIDAGYDVASSDLVDRGYGQTGVDFLMEWQGRAPNIVTNPPFKNSVEFARHALHLATHKVAFLCRLAWLEGIERKALFEGTPLARVWVFSKRLTMLRGGWDGGKGGGGMTAFAWFVWDRGHIGRPTLGWIVPKGEEK